jgi:hypothetical protein
MVVLDHPSFRLPENLETPIWRYVDFPKFVSMLETAGGSLHFSRPDHPNFDDSYEAVPPKRVQQAIERTWTDAVNGQTNKSDRDGVRELTDCFRDVAKSVRRLVGVNCWHCSEHESAAMWKLYGASYGIVVRSTVQRLLDALRKARETVRVGLVEYIDTHDTKAWDDYAGRVSTRDLYHWILAKRKSFEHEKELRAVIGDLGHISTETEFSKEGKTIPVPVGVLIESVTVAPKAEPWLGELVGQLCDRYGVHIEVQHSSLGERSLW